MKNLIAFVIGSVATTLCVLNLAPLVKADSGQYGQYGQPAPAQTILIDKTVGKPNAIMTKGGLVNVEYVDNLSPADPRFRPGQQVLFKIKVKNTSTVSLSQVTVQDYVPTYVEPMEGPGNYDAGTRIISWDAGSFAPNEEKTYDLKMQLYPQDKLPANKGLFCLTNKAQASNSVTSDDDTAQFCVEKEVIGVKKAPEAGPEAGVLILGANVLLAGVGFSLKRLTNKK